MKKTQKLIFAVVTMVLSLFLLTACGLQTHMHDYSEWGFNDENHWMYCKDDNVKDDETVAAHTFTERGTDETYHWMYCPTCGAIQQSSKGSHVDEDFDGKCDVCEYKVPVYVNFGGKVTLIKGGAAAVSTNEGVTISVSDDQGEIDLKDFVFNEDGTFSFTAEEGEYTIEASKDGYMTAVGVIELDHENEITDYDQLKLEYKLLQVALKPNYDSSLHDFSHMNDEKPYIMHTYSAGGGKTLDVETVLPQDNAVFTWYAEKGHAVANSDRVGVWVKFYNSAKTSSNYIWFQAIGDKYQYAVYNGGGWGPAPNMMQGKSTYSADMSEAEKAQFDAGTLELSIGRYENMVFVIVNGELRDTIILDEEYATQEAYLGLVGWDVSAEDGQNKFYFNLTEDASNYLPEEHYDVTVPTADNVKVTANREVVYKGQKVIYTITPDKGYMILSVKVNGTEKLGELVDNKLTIEDYTDETTVEITAVPEEIVTINVTAHEVYEGSEITFVKDGATNTVTIEDGTATFEGYCGYWTAQIKFNGKNYDFGSHFVDIEGNLVIDENAMISSVISDVCLTYPNGGKKAAAKISPVTGKGVVYQTGGNMMRHVTYASYDTVAVTMYLNSAMRKTSEETGPMLSFDGDFVWFGINGTTLQWLTNTWHDGDGGNHTKNMTSVSNPVLSTSLTSEEQVLFSQGKLPVTLVRNGVMVFAFVNGRYAGSVTLAEEYAAATVQPGFSGLGIKEDASFDMIITDGSEYFGATNFTVEITGEGLDNLIVNGLTESGVYNTFEKYTFSFATKAHPNAPTNSYAITAFKVNGEAADYTKALEYLFTNMKTEQKLEIYAVVEQVGPVDVTVTADAAFNGYTVEITQGDVTQELTFADGKAEFNGLPGAYSVVLKNYYGVDLALEDLAVNKDGTATLSGATATTECIFNTSGIWWPGNKITATFDVVTGKGTTNQTNGTLHHITNTNYNTVAITQYMSKPNLASKQEKAGMLLTFSNNDYIFVIVKYDGSVEWDCNTWMDQTTYKTITETYYNGFGPSKWHIYDSYGNFMYQGGSHLTDEEKAMYEAGTLPFTLVRDGSNVYLFLNGKYLGMRALDAKYATMTAKVGLTAWGITAGTKYDYQIETDVSDYLAKCTGESTFNFKVNCNMPDAITLTGKTEGYKLNEFATLKVGTIAHSDANKEYLITSFKVNGQAADYTKEIKLFVLDKNLADCVVDITVAEVTHVEANITIPASLGYEGLPMTFTLYDRTFTANVQDGKVTQTTIAGVWTVSVKYLGLTWSLGTVEIYEDGTGELPESAVLNEFFNAKDQTYASNQATSKYNVATGEGTITLINNADTFRHNTKTSYDQVAITMYLNDANDGSEPSGLMVMFKDTSKSRLASEYVWASIKGGKIQYYDDAWNDKSDTSSKKAVVNITESCEKYLTNATLTDEEKAMYEAGTLPFTLVRDGAMVYTFLNGRYIGYIVAPAKYATEKATVGFSGLGLTKNCTYNYKIETDISAYLAQCTGEANFTMNVTGTNTDALIVNGLKSGYSLNEFVTLTFAAKAGYKMNSLKVNGSEVANTYVYSTHLFTKGVTLSVEVEIVEDSESNLAEIVLKPYEKIYTESEWRDLTEGTVLTFYNETTDTTVKAAYAGESLKVALADGTWTVSASGYVSQTLVVSEGAVDSEALRMTRNILVGTSGTITEDENGAKVVFTEKVNNGKDVVLYTPFKGTYILEATYVGSGSWDDGIRTLKSDNNRIAQNSYLLNIGEWGENVFFKWDNDNSYAIQYKIADYKINDVYTAKIRVVVSGCSIEASVAMLGKDGNYTAWSTKSYTASAAYKFGFSASKASTWSNITVTDDVLYSNGKDTDKYTITKDANGGKVVFTDASSTGYAILCNPYVYGEKYVLEATYCGNTKLKNNEAFEDRIMFVDGNGSAFAYLLNIGTWHDDSYYIKWRNNNTYTHTVSEHMVNNLYTAKLKITFDGKNISTATAVLKADGTYTDWMTKSFVYDAKEYATVGFSAGYACTWSNIRVYKA